jgi:cation diffusion facilitator CzcD-associated flavoprotein CzcO
MARRDLDVCIIGAGMSGLLMGIVLRRAGIQRFRILEKASSVGGTWRENRYPGLTCDVPSHFYSYSFAPNPDWSHRFSPGPEIRAYFERVADEYGVLPHVTFGEEVAGARREDSRWAIHTKSGKRFDADVLIHACGPLHVKKYPDFEGMQSFAGAMFHSADWPDDQDLAGRRIGVVGTGSSAVQMMEPLSRVASHLSMFQRTAQWIMPIGNRRYTDAQRRRARLLPFIPWIARRYYRFAFESFSNAVVEPGKRRQAMTRRCRRHLRKIRDPELRRKLTPDYQPACKRLILSRTFYPTLQKPHVELVTERILRVEPRGVVTADGRLHELDVLVLATGFDAHALGVEAVVGEHGRTLREAWASGDRAYRSVAFPGFPNFFMLVGPNSPIGNVSLIDVSEVQAAYILRLLRLLERGEAREIVPRADATRTFHATLLEAMKRTVWVTGCKSWYLDEQGVPITWPWSAARFHRDMRRPNLADFELRQAEGRAQ